ncbi:MAG: winged helix-turn-helix transcriptional regulator [Archaeoglobaceae archaeon]
MGEDPQYIKGKILRAIQGGKKHFKEILDETKFSANTITKYTRELERDGLIIIEFDRNIMKLVYKLNKAKTDEINKLIEAYLKSEEEQLEKSFIALAKSDPEKARNVIKRLQSFLGKEIFEDEDSGK